MAISCVSYLCSSFDLIDETIARSESLERVLPSFYSLHLYANEHWLQHLLAYCHDVGGLQAASSTPLCDLLIRLVTRQSELWCSFQRSNSQFLSNPLTVTRDPQEFLRNYLSYREVLKRKVETTGEGMIQNANSDLYTHWSDKYSDE